MNVYISGGITGVKNYMEAFAEAERYLTGKGYKVFNPAKVNAQLPEGTTYEEYMNVSFCLLDMCEAIFMLDGWETSLGANREYGYALGKDKIILTDVIPFED